MLSIRLSGFGNSEVEAYTKYFSFLCLKATGEDINVVTDTTLVDIEIILYPSRSRGESKYKILLTAEACKDWLWDYGCSDFDNIYACGCATLNNPYPTNIPSDHYEWWPFAAWCWPNIVFPDILRAEREQRKFVPKKRFCSFVRVNGKGNHRDQLYYKLSSYNRIDSAGSWSNNMSGGWKVSGAHYSDSLREFYSSGKFVIAAENTITPGYVTEKIINAFRSGCVPIYWGNLETTDGKPLFNPAAYINIADYPNVDAAITFIKFINDNDDIYQEMINAPLWATCNNGPHQSMTDKPFINTVKKIWSRLKTE
jgi:hypothetical protein